MREIIVNCQLSIVNCQLKKRDVAQLVAHYVRDVGVAGSSPVIPTHKKTSREILEVFCGANGIRTSDTRIFSPMLYQLSYGTKCRTSKNATQLPPLIKTSFPRLRMQRYNIFLKPPNKNGFFLKIIVNCQLSTVNYQCSIKIYLKISALRAIGFRVTGSVRVRLLCSTPCGLLCQSVATPCWLPLPMEPLLHPRAKDNQDCPAATGLVDIP